jgi:hypothetical protein
MVSHSESRRAPNQREMDLRWESLSGRGDVGAMRWLLRTTGRVPETRRDVTPEKVEGKVSS